MGRQSNLPLSQAEKIKSVKMSIMPRFVFLFQTFKRKLLITINYSKVIF